MSFASGKQIQLKEKLNPADDSLTADVDVGVTNGRFYFLNDLQEEWMSFDGVAASGSNFVYSNLVRGLSQTADPATAGTGLTWLAGNIGILVQMHDQMADTKTSNTWTGTQTVPDIRFSGTTTSGLRVKSLTTTQRNALTAANGDIVYDSTEGVHYQYIGGAWSTFATGSTANASTTVAGKVEIATDAEITAGTATGGTGASLVLTPEQQKKSISLKNVASTLSGVNELVVNQGGEDRRIAVTTFGEESGGFLNIPNNKKLFTAGENMSAGDFFRTGNDLLIQSVGASSNARQFAVDTGVQSAAGTILIGTGTKIFNLGLYLVKNNSPTMVSTLKIYSDSGYTNLIDTSINTLTSADSTGLKVFNLNGVYIPAGTFYFILEPNAVNATNNWSFYTSTLSGQTAWILSSTKTQTATYTNSTARYELNYGLTDEASTKKYISNATSVIYSTVEGIVDADVLANADFYGVVSGIKGGFTSLIPGQIYYLQNDGTPGLNQGTISKKVGISNSTTEINYIQQL